MKGDQSGNAFSVSVRDAKGETFVYFLPQGIDWKGWKFVRFALENHPSHPSRSGGYQGAHQGEIAWPVSVIAMEAGWLKGSKTAIQLIPEIYFQEKR